MLRSGSTIVFLLAATLGWVGGGLRAAVEASPYESLDESRLAKALKDLGMTELLDELVRRKAGAGDISAKALLAQSRIAAALRAKDQQTRDRLLDEALKIQDELIAATKNAVNDFDVLRHLRFRLDRAVTEGITKVEPYADRLLYFQERPGDVQAVEKLTGSALRQINRVTTLASLRLDDWGGDPERIVTGAVGRLEELLREARYRGAWIRLYRGMALPPGSPERAGLLRQAIVDVDEFANAEDNSSGVKFPSLLLSGMAARELGEWDAARSFLKRAGDASADPLVRLKALFETTRSYMDEGRFEEARTWLDRFRRQGSALLGARGKVAVDMQAALLKRRLLKLRAEKVAQTDPAEAARLRRASIGALLEFIDRNPQYTQAFVEIIAAEFEGRSPEGLPPGILVAFAARELSKGTPKGDRRAEEYLNKALAAGIADAGIHARALWYRAVARARQKRNLAAAEDFEELARSYPNDPQAKNAALGAVKIYYAILKAHAGDEQRLPKEFFRKYIRALETLIRGFGESDPQVRSYNYELAQQYDRLGRRREAIAAFSRIDPSSPLYLPSRYRILNLRVEMLRRSHALTPQQRRKLAQDLLADLKTYRDRALKYVGAASDRRRREQVRAWGAECDMQIAYLLKDFLDAPDEAAAHARAVAARWPKVPGLRRRSQEFIVRLLLEAGKTDQAIEMLRNLSGAHELVAEAIRQIRIRIERLEQQPRRDVAERLRAYRQAYKFFAERLYTWAKDRKLPPEKMYAYKQVAAGAWESGSRDELAKALRLYQELDRARPRDAVNIRGLARCYRGLGKNRQAMEYYTRLVNGLPQKSSRWWRAQLERLEFALEMYKADAQGLRDILLQIRVLDLEDAYLGGLATEFNRIRGQARRRLEALSAAGATHTQPAGASVRP